VAVFCVLSVYSYPALRTPHTQRLPVISAPDLGLYLSLSTLKQPRSDVIVNPYYHVDVPATGAGFLKFRLGPVLFGWLTRLLSGNLWQSLFLWNLIWWSLACLAAIWLFERFLPDPSWELVLAALAMLMFFNFGGMKQEIVGWLHFPGMSYFGEIGLPYIRAFSPQIALPLLLLYAGLQIVALRDRRPLAWLVMAVLQLFACASFPYATLLMAGTTAIAAAWDVLTRSKESAWRAILWYAFCCAALDSIFMLRGAPVFRSGMAGEAPLIQFQAAALPSLMGKLWFFLGGLCVAVALSRKLAPEVRWTLVGLGVANMLMLLGDALVPGPPMFLTNHASYFEHATIVILLTFAVDGWVPIANGNGFFRVSCVLATAFFCLNGVMLAEGGYRKLLPTNREQVDIVNWFGRGEAAPGDLIVTQHDMCAWVPFVTEAQVLFCRNSQAMLSPQQNRDLQRVREAWYLNFTDKGSQWVNAIVHDPANVHKLETFGMYGEVSSYLGPLRTRQVEHIRSQLVPVLERIEAQDPTMIGFLRQFPRVWVIENRGSPVFAPARLGQYLDIHSEEIFGDLSVRKAAPKAQ
jgi:hypothetical protein